MVQRKQMDRVIDKSGMMHKLEEKTQQKHLPKHRLRPHNLKVTTLMISEVQQLQNPVMSRNNERATLFVRYFRKVLHKEIAALCGLRRKMQFRQ